MASYGAHTFGVASDCGFGTCNGGINKMMIISRDEHVKEIEKLETFRVAEIKKAYRRMILTVTGLLAITAIAVGFMYDQAVQENLRRMENGQVASCLRENNLSTIISAGNEIEIELLSKEIDSLDAYPPKQRATTEFKELRKSKVDSREIRIARRPLLQPFPCQSLRR